MELQQRIEHLFIEQRKDWGQLNLAIEQLSKIKTKEFSWGDNNNVVTQFIPHINSSLPKENVFSEKCSLCEANRPKEQKGIEFTNKYIILINPFPILNNHITITLHTHVLQRIRKKIGDMLTLAEELPDYVITYDGPINGVTATNEHFNFQAGLKNEILLQGDNELRTCLVIESESISEAEESFEDVYYYLTRRQQEAQEPMMNIIAFVEEGKYVIHIFPRKEASSSQYYQTGRDKLIITPTAVDMSGLITITRQDDFDKIKKEDIEDIYSQLSMSVI